MTTMVIEPNCWVVCQDGKPIINTVHDRRVGAIVNWLYMLTDYKPTAFDTDDRIEEVFAHRPAGITIHRATAIPKAEEDERI